MVSHAPLCALLVFVISVVRACITHCSFRLSSSSHLKKFRGSKKDDEEVRSTSKQKNQLFSLLKRLLTISAAGA